jgi:hypothetical protein
VVDPAFIKQREKLSAKKRTTNSITELLLKSGIITGGVATTFTVTAPGSGPLVLPCSSNKNPQLVGSSGNLGCVPVVGAVSFNEAVLSPTPRAIGNKCIVDHKDNGV